MSMNTGAASVALPLIVGLLLGCGTPASDPDVSAEPVSGTVRAASDSGPFVRVLGTVQDGGLPHAACSCERCEAARTDSTRARHVASIAIVIPATSRVYLVDATPDIRPQLDALRDVRAEPAGRVDRAPIDGVLLTHAHIGHYLGLAHLGYEAVSTSALPVYCTPRMARFLRANGPWSQLVSKSNIELREVLPSSSFELDGDVEIAVVPVPHRDEYSDTVGFRIAGPRRTVLYVPDTDAWDRWQPPLAGQLEGVDVALVDGSFYSMDELPGRDLSSIPHPLISQSMDLLENRVRAGTLEVHFTHMNHSNPALEPAGPARREILARGFGVLEDGQEFPL